MTGKRDWVETLVAIGKALGFNEVRLRWKLMNLKKGAAESKERAEAKAGQLKYDNIVCPSCGAVQPRGSKRCSSCDEPLPTWSGQVISRIGLSLPKAVSVSTLFVVAFIAVYARMILFQEGGGILSLEVSTLYHFGANFAPAIREGEWWRLGTAMFLHVGIWHIGFNVFALSQIGPHIEAVFGRLRMVLFFMLTGIAANVVSVLLLDLTGVQAGASGGLMGLVGLSAGWGHRDGTTIGKTIRNLMLKWAAYTMVFGMLIGADNAAHASGFVVGGLMGLMVKPQASVGRIGRTVWRVLGTLGALSALGAGILALVPPTPAVPLEQTVTSEAEAWETISKAQTVLLFKGCMAFEEGDLATAKALLGKSTELMQKLVPFNAGAMMDEGFMVTYCEGINETITTCEAFRKEGISAVTGGQGELKASEIKNLELHWDKECSMIESLIKGDPP